MISIANHIIKSFLFLHGLFIDLTMEIAPAVIANSNTESRYGYKRNRPKGTPLQFRLAVSAVANTENHAYKPYYKELIKSGLANPYVADKGAWNKYLRGGQPKDWGVNFPGLLDNQDLAAFDPATGHVRKGADNLNSATTYAAPGTTFGAERAFEKIPESAPVTSTLGLGAIFNIPQPAISLPQRPLPDFCATWKYSSMTQETTLEPYPTPATDQLRTNLPITTLRRS